MVEEEFMESEVIFSDHSSNHCGTHDEDAAVHDDGYFDYRGFSKNDRVSRNYKSKNKKIAVCSLPVNIRRHHGTTVFHCGEADDFEEEEDEEGEIVQPHVISGRRIAGKMAFSVCNGNGMTLKGRDLSQVRNSIMRMTGFLEAKPMVGFSRVAIRICAELGSSGTAFQRKKHCWSFCLGFGHSTNSSSWD